MLALRYAVPRGRPASSHTDESLPSYLSTGTLRAINFSTKSRLAASFPLCINMWKGNPRDESSPAFKSRSITLKGPYCVTSESGIGSSIVQIRICASDNSQPNVSSWLTARLEVTKSVTRVRIKRMTHVCNVQPLLAHKLSTSYPRAAGRA